MELVNTLVSRSTSEHVVKFLGEGGEAVSVTMATGDQVREDAEIIEKAKQMLVQIVAFDQPDVGTAAPEESEAGVYTFEYQDHGVVRIMPGISLPSRQAVQDEVKRSAEDLWKDALDKLEAPVGWAVRARDSHGEVVATCSYEDIQLREP
ncbi:DUF6894 family protein [Mesorhizobium amorphae]|uniref:DUF6894 family protein n=1 Tax=Mesorhizobium amorphae TaxID=71433 RepID=UPI0017859D17|nr:hypothetical protein [Mesorhizobium amorphae]